MYSNLEFEFGGKATTACDQQNGRFEFDQRKSAFGLISPPILGKKFRPATDIRWRPVWSNERK
jgi:hypothetical protein